MSAQKRCGTRTIIEPTVGDILIAKAAEVAAENPLTFTISYETPEGHFILCSPDTMGVLLGHLEMMKLAVEGNLAESEDDSDEVDSGLSDPAEE